ncbi:MAG: hypothetical protein QNJ31_01710 [Candidatus Caenarcaniphilales bacterium]|nr:hypothetical protein [Candidatus Caenarcaniphilales bacterium]
MGYKSSVSSEIKIKCNQSQTFAFHENLCNISKVLPPFINVKINKIEYPVQQNSEANLILSFFGLFPLLNWKLRFKTFEKPYIFVDEEIGGLFEEFSHTHQFIPLRNDLNVTIVKDDVTFSLNDSFINRTIGSFLVKKIITIALRLKLISTKKVLEERHRS